MSDTNYAFKTDDETKEKIKKLIDESGNSSKDFFSNLIGMYELQKAKETSPIITADIEELETLTRRINGIFVNVSERINTLQRETKDEQERQAENNQSTISLLQQTIDGLKQDRLDDEDRIKLFIEDKERAEQHAAELQQRIKELEDAAKDKAALVEEYKRKNDDLSGIVSEYMTAAEKSKELERDNTRQAAEIQEKQKQIAHLTKEKDEFIRKHAEDLKRQQDTLNIEREKSILELERQQQAALNEQQAAYSKKLDEYETKILSMINEKTENKPSTATSKKTPTRSKKNTSKEPTETNTETES